MGCSDGVDKHTIVASGREIVHVFFKLSLKQRFLNLVKKLYLVSESEDDASFSFTHIKKKSLSTHHQKIRNEMILSRLWS